jgi:7-carboxy-7-deazaguanine synthase
MKVREVFYSVQGEGLFIGHPTVFVRFIGCSLKCPECDTRYSWKENCPDVPDVGPAWVLDKIIDVVPRPKHICITGGEPLEQPRPEMFALLNALQTWVGARGLERIVIETNGAQDITWMLGHKFMSAVCLSVDFKPPSTGKSGSMLARNFTSLRECDVIKFVCKDKADFDFCADFAMSTLSHPSVGKPLLLFHANGGSAQGWLAEELLKRTELNAMFNTRVGVQLHKLINQR